MQAKETVLADVRQIISEQLGKDLDAVRLLWTLATIASVVACLCD